MESRRLLHVAIAWPALLLLSGAVVVAQPGAAANRGGQAVLLPECVRDALGGRPFQEIASLRLSLETVTPPTEVVGGSREISIRWPDRFVEREALAGLPPTAMSLVGRELRPGILMDGKWLVRTPGDVATVMTVRRFAELSLIWLLRTPSAFPVEYLVQEGGGMYGPRTVVGTGPDNFRVTIALDPSCIPRSMTIVKTPDPRMPNPNAKLSATATETYELLDYRLVGSVRLPHRVLGSADGRSPWEWRVVSVSVDVPLDDDTFELK